MKITNITDVNESNFIGQQAGEYRAIVKSQSGMITVCEDLGLSNKWASGQQWKRAIDVFRGFKKGALQSIQFRPAGSDNWLPVFGRSGKRVIVMDQQLFGDMLVGDINQHWSNTNLYNQNQYHMVNAKTWESRAFVANK